MKESLSPWILPFLCWRATNCFPRTDIRLDCLSLSLSGCNLYLTLKNGNAFANSWWHPNFSKLFSRKNEKYPSITLFLTSKSHCLSNSCFGSFFLSDSIINCSYWGPQSNSNRRVIKRRIAYLRLKEMSNIIFFFL